MNVSSYVGMTAVLYARVSTDGIKQDTASQMLELRRWCRENEVKVLGEYADEITGRTIDRPELDKMIGRIVRGGVNLVVALDPDRLSRDMGGKSELLKFIQPYGTVIRCLSDLSLAPETEEGRLLDTMKTYGAQKYVSGHSLKIKAGQARVRANGTRSGKPIGRPAAFVDMEIAMQCADSGLSVSEAAASMKIGRETLRRKLINSERIEEFYERLEKAGGSNSNGGLVDKAIERIVYERRYQRSKTPMPDNTVSLYPNGQKTGGGE